MNMFDPNEMAQAAQLKQIEEMKKQLLGKILSKEAYERLGRVRLANPELASQAELYILQVYQTGKLEDSITDEQMREVLRALSEGKRDFRIKRT
ncbi:MAG: hypothetical protein JW754_01655 [Candidatus Aenigmarchaeota archaeon]|nr:hypothetical protein [Candidatus Aenigmarchaeota archaeon]